MEKCKKIIAGIMALSVLMSMTGCKNKKKDISRFGIDINSLNPLFMTAVDGLDGRKVFSRDPSIISAVIMLFMNMELTPKAQLTNEKGISFTATTMYGDFYFGECRGNWLRISGKEYELEKDYSEDIRLIYERLASETEHTVDVTREKILAVTPEMTYRELLESFGQTLETAVVGERKAWLYKYNDRPFYIRYKSQDDKVNMTGRQLLEQIWKNYNLDQSLTSPEPPGSGRLSVYKQAFGDVIDACLYSYGDLPFSLLINTDILLYIDDNERQQLVDYLKSKYSVKIQDTALAGMAIAGDALNETDSEQMVAWVKHYSFVGDKRMNFAVAAKLGKNDTVTLNMRFKLKENRWEKD
ncbi:MAG: hypothetical protein PHX02_00705 [Oscillospiraceae bacterium]|nr:hypothetical protein [Oscillospiraceae bacterium]